MNEGRKTRRSKGGKNEMAKINRQWQQISAVSGPVLCTASACTLANKKTVASHFGTLYLYQ